jgi:adenosylhomocysteinase
MRKIPELTDLPELKYFCKMAGSDVFSEVAILMVVHLLPDCPAFIQAFEECGADPQHIFLVGVPYSVKERVVEALSNRSCKLEVTSYEEMTAKVRETLSEAFRICGDTNKHLLVIEDGGYTVPLLHVEFPDRLGRCVGAVEQTTRGIRQDIEHDLRIPVISIPDCELKRKFEGPYAGRSVVANIENLLGGPGSLSGITAGVIGYGTVGQSVANELRSIGTSVIVFDKDPIKMLIARANGFRCAGGLIDLASSCKLIIGATGDTSITRSMFLHLNHGCKLVSASSRRIEIDIPQLEAVAISRRKIEGFGTEYTLLNGRTIILLADGFPINFYGDAEGIPDRMISIVLALIFRGAVKLVSAHLKGAPLKPGLHLGIGTDLEAEIAEFSLELDF